MEHLKQSVQLRSYAQKNPMDEFKRESFEMFNRMLDTISYETLSRWHMLQPAEPKAAKASRGYQTQTSIHFDDSQVT